MNELLTVVTASLPERSEPLSACRASVASQSLTEPLRHLVALDTEHEGPAVVRNRLVDQVTTPFVLFLDDDDELLPGYLAAVAPLLPETDVLYTGWRHCVNGELHHETQGVKFSRDGLRVANFIPVTACVRVDAFRAVDGFDPCARLEDWSLWLRLSEAGYRFTHLPLPLWTYNPSLTGRNAA